MYVQKMDFLHSPTLFRDDHGNGLYLVIKSDPKNTEVEELFKAIKHGGGLVSEKTGEYSITFASPDYKVVEDEELYSYGYIKDCCDRNKLLDLRPYRLNKQSKYPENFNPNDVFLKYTTWENALKGKSYKRFELPFKLDDDETDSSNSSDTTIPVSVPASCEMRKKRTSGLMKRISILESSDSEFSDETCLRKLEIEDKLKNKQKETSDSRDQEDSARHTRSRIEDSARHTRSRIEDSARHTRSRCTETFAKRVEERKRYRESSSESVDSSIADAPSRKRSLKVLRREYAESDRMSIINYIIENKAYSSVKGREFWQKMEAKQICHGRTWQSLKEHFVKKILPRIDKFGLPEKEVKKFKNQEDNSNSYYSSLSESVPISGSKRRDYSKAEKMKIINYIIQHKDYDHVKGRHFWLKMEMNKICPGRTWQSLKEHYTKQIIPKIESFGLPNDEVHRLKRVFR